MSLLTTATLSAHSQHSLDAVPLGGGKPEVCLERRQAQAARPKLQSLLRAQQRELGRMPSCPSWLESILTAGPWAWPGLRSCHRHDL